ncbi:NADP-dependent aryl-alcohol dehydrogenase [Jeotgalibacillus soli]|uniref:NADP-dependent aryl-alcohol dehydrogenase n=1 Tax=Jeotgalibacillus soli TaxID=889306 RepID=A0A0C2V819_9BACL|nr:NADP-dependent aryl-alcohol dehydrogenase [Jeotgalibacillus soli]
MEREILQLCKEAKIGVIPYSPLASGRLTRHWNDIFITEATE